MSLYSLPIDEQPVRIGRFGKAFGLLGEIKVISFTIPLQKILQFKPWLIQQSDTWEEICWDGGKEAGKNIVVKLRDYNTPESLKFLVNKEISVWRKQLPQLSLGEYYWHDLVGLKVVNCEGVDLGKVESLLATGANDVLVVRGGKKYLIPYITQVILEVNLDTQVIVVDWGEDYS